jgi:hypothetical protein
MVLKGREVEERLGKRGRGICRTSVKRGREEGKRELSAQALERT